MVNFLLVVGVLLVFCKAAGIGVFASIAWPVILIPLMVWGAMFLIGLVFVLIVTALK